jgi:hypothetical protein
MVREILPRMLIMDEGRIVGDGPTDELMKDVRLLDADGLEKPQINLAANKHHPLDSLSFPRIINLNRRAYQ